MSELFPCIDYELIIFEEEGIFGIVVVRKTMFLAFESAFHNSMFRHYFLSESLLLFL